MTLRMYTLKCCLPPLARIEIPGERTLGPGEHLVHLFLEPSTANSLGELLRGAGVDFILFDSKAVAVGDEVGPEI